jgi:hypothetical protein
MLEGVADLHTRVTDTLVQITGRLVGDYDSAAVLRQVTSVCTDLLGAAATGVMLADPRGGIDVIHASDEGARFVELLQTQTEQGPCIDCMRTAELVSVPDLEAELQRWPDFVPAAVDAGYRSIYAVPMRLRAQGVGGLNLLYADTAELPAWQLHLAQAMADLTILGLTQEHDSRRTDRLTEQTLIEFNDRVQLGQAIGLVAGTLGIEPDLARAALAEYANRQGRHLRDAARAITDGVIDVADIAAERTDRG